MSEHEFELDDPRLTGYVMGELSADEQQRLEQWLASSSEGRQRVDELRTLAEQVFSALQTESRSLQLNEPDSGIHDAVEQALAVTPDPRLVKQPAERHPAERHRRLRGSGVLALIATTAALGLLWAVSISRHPELPDSGRQLALRRAYGRSPSAEGRSAAAADGLLLAARGTLPSAFYLRDDIQFQDFDAAFALPGQMNGLGTTGAEGESRFDAPESTTWGVAPGQPLKERQVRGRELAPGASGSKESELERRLVEDLRSQEVQALQRSAELSGSIPTVNGFNRSDSLSDLADPAPAAVVVSGAVPAPTAQPFFKLGGVTEGPQPTGKRPSASGAAPTDLLTRFGEPTNPPAAGQSAAGGTNSRFYHEATAQTTPQTVDIYTSSTPLTTIAPLAGGGITTPLPSVPAQRYLGFTGLQSDRLRERQLLSADQQGNGQATVYSTPLLNKDPAVFGDAKVSDLAALQNDRGAPNTTTDPTHSPLEEQLRLKSLTITSYPDPDEAYRLAGQNPAAGTPLVLEVRPQIEGKRGEQLLQLSRRLTRGGNRADRFSFDSLSASLGTESYAPIVENEFLSPTDQPYSTFGIDVDTGSYTNIRRFLHQNRMPPRDAVRLEELINAFDYDLTPPNEEHPVAITLESARCPWQHEHRLVRIGLKARTIDTSDRPPTSLVFLVDVSGSMKDGNKLPLVQAALRLLIQEMEESDQIAIVTYANDARIALPSTNGTERDEILARIDSLRASGSTNGTGGLNLAYDVASANAIPEGANRILLCTDGDFNVGVSDDSGVFELIEDHRKSNVFLSVLGFGSGNLKDSKLEGLANRGNGHYHYIDQLAEANRVLVEQLTGTLYTIAKDVKLQVEFNPNRVASHRLLGYENRALAAKDFNNDRVDAGDMGAGHTVTALYELAVKGDGPQPESGVDAPRYQSFPKSPGEQALPPDPEGERTRHRDELLFVKLRYKQPDSNESVKLEVPLAAAESAQAPSGDFAWAAAVASFGMVLRDSQFKGNGTWETVLDQARQALEQNSNDRRIEFVDLVLRARGLWRKSHGQAPARPKQFTSLEARKKAECEGKYLELLDKFTRPDDLDAFGAFHEFGYRHGENFLGKDGTPDGYWVYVFPDWYVWQQKAD